MEENVIRNIIAMVQELEPERVQFLVNAYNIYVNGSIYYRVKEILVHEKPNFLISGIYKQGNSQASTDVAPSFPGWETNYISFSSWDF